MQCNGIVCELMCLRMQKVMLFLTLHNFSENFWKKNCILCNVIQKHLNTGKQDKNTEAEHHFCSFYIWTDG